MKDLKSVVERAVTNVGATKVSYIKRNQALIELLRNEKKPHNKASLDALTQLKFRFVDEIVDDLEELVFGDNLVEQHNLYTTPEQWKAYMDAHNGMDMYIFTDENINEQVKKDYFHTVASLVYEHIINDDFEIPSYWVKSYENK